LGALGGIVASRIAREFRFGGPSFAVSSEEASGLRALDIGIQMLRRNEQEAALVGAVDLFGDIRRLISRQGRRAFSPTGKIRPFDPEADGTLPGEGAAALVLKPLDKALADGHRIYAVITGVGHAGADWNASGAPCAETHQRALALSLKDAALSPEAIGFYESHGSGEPAEDQIEARVLTEIFSNNPVPFTVGTLKPNIGHSGAAAGLAAIVKSALCLFYETLPPQSRHALSSQFSLLDRRFEMSHKARPWPAAAPTLPRSACVSAMTPDGNSSAVIIEGVESYVTNPLKPQTMAAAPVTAPEPHQRARSIRVPVGGPVLQPSKAKQWVRRISAPPQKRQPAPDRHSDQEKIAANHAGRILAAGSKDAGGATAAGGRKTLNGNHEMVETLVKGSQATSRIHQTFLAFSKNITRSFQEAFELQTRLYQHLILRGPDRVSAADPSAPIRPTVPSPAAEPVTTGPTVAFNRNQCLEFAVGRIANVLGPEFAEVDGYKTRVRLPAEPLMLVDRILKVEGRMRSLSAGRIVTEHEVRAGAWYLDGDRAPVSIAVEAGQADLFLCAYLGIDLAVRGERVYRLLDASVVFHRGLPRPGETIRYEIEIEKFIRQGPTYLFLFNFSGYIGDERLIRMTDGCAGFFTDDEIRNSGGIVRTEKPRHHPGRHRSTDRCDLVPTANESYDAAAVEALRRGDLATCFGPAFAGVSIAESLRLPGGRMKLIDRIQVLEPSGGRYGLGMIRAEADIQADDWFLTCHFVDDMTMPGTLMYECCAHTLRIFLQRIGWISDRPDVCYEPLLGIKSVLKCRGPVTPQTRQVLYEVEIKDIGWTPEPYVVADAHMYADGRYIVQFEDMSMKMTGLTRQALESFWDAKRGQRPGPARRRPLFERRDILAFAVGKPSQAFGAPYEPFDAQRFIARLPGPPYTFIDRIVAVEPQPWELRPDGWIEAEFDVRPDHWYFRADRNGIVPYCVLLEMGLQSCGWLAAYMGSALKSNTDLRFRNLDGQALLHRDVWQQEQTLRVRCRLKKASVAGDTIIETFEYGIFQENHAVYEGVTSFGFFTTEALAQQRGIAEDAGDLYAPNSEDIAHAQPFIFEAEAPTTPEDPRVDKAASLAMPAKALRMIDRVDLYLPRGGCSGLGFARGTKRVDPREWFFKAHFFQDPVCPGSLGIESFLQLLKYVAMQRWKEKVHTHMFTHLTQANHRWKYRGQILPNNRCVTVDAEVTEIRDGRDPEIRADGVLRVDGLCIYKMENFGIRLVKKRD
jgi:3-hydroxymyristoyl/3-hydroxydecanoyl-(acyl carrier protein) dehydratase